MALDRVKARHDGGLLATAYILLAVSRRARSTEPEVALACAGRIADAIRDLLHEVSPL
jgi:hypothetical protein